MAFDQSNFATIGAHSSNSPKVYSYKSNDSLAQVTATDYFIAKRLQLTAGDLIYSVLSNGNFEFQVSADKSTVTQFVAVPVDNCRVGLFDYNDLATASAPIVVTTVGSPFVLTNDGLGSFTNKLFPPIGVTDVWNASSDVFDWSELKLGDMVDIRLDFDLITSSVNTEIKVDLHLGTGGSAYTIPYIPESNFKNAGTHNINRYNGIYMGDENTLNNGGQFKISTDKDCTVIVNGWFTKIIIRG